MKRPIHPPSGRPPRVGIRDTIDNLATPMNILLLSHSTNSYTLREIVESNAIKPINCKLFEEELIYTYYGRASFRGSGEFNVSSLVSLFPSLLVIDPRNAPLPKYVFCFDSGAFIEGMMDNYLHPYMPLLDFLLAPDPLSAARLVNAMYPDARAYISNKPDPKLPYLQSDFEIASYIEIVKNGGQGSNILDDRSSTPEIIFSQALDLPRCVVAAILPDVISADPNIGGALRDRGISTHPYPFHRSGRPIEVHMTIRQIFQQIMESRGLL